MRKEIYKVRRPKHIVFGDPLYFKEFEGDELKRLTVDYSPPEAFDAARLVLQEEPDKELPEYMDRWMTLYMAPRQAIDIYVSERLYASQKIAEKGLGVDTARYYLNVDGRGGEIHTGGDGWWGRFEEYYRETEKARHSDAAILTIAIPEEYDFEGMKELAAYFFEGMERQPDSPKRKAPER